MNLIVSDNSPLSLLAAIGQLAILPQLFDRIYIPPAVHLEMMQPSSPAGAKALAMNPPSWLTIQAPSRSIVHPGIDKGESEAIALALELPSTLLIDEYRGRRYAVSAGLTVIGAVGLLELAANLGLIAQLNLIHDTIRGAGFYVSEQLLQDSLQRHLNDARNLSGTP